MSRIKSLWWTALIFAICLFKPATGLCFEQDPYRFRTFIGTLYLEFGRTTSKNGNSASVQTRFRQVITLDLRSWILSRRLVVYDAGIQLDNTDYNSSVGNGSSDKRSLSYYLKTTLLPKSLIPLTLHAKQTNSTSSDGGKTLSTNYGFRWFANLRRLPATTISADKDSAVGNDIDIRSATYKIEMRKELGSSKNEFIYNNKTDNNKLSGIMNNTSDIRFTNTTEISRNSKFYLGFTRTDLSGNNAPSSAFEGISASFISQPSADFSQSHSYTSYSSKTTDGMSTGVSYSGSLDYKISQRLTTSMSLSLNNTENVSPSIKVKDEGLSTSGFIAYAVTPNLKLSENLDYSQYKSTSSDPATPNLTDRIHLKLVTKADYKKKLAWADLSSNYGVGYTEDKTDKDAGGKGLVQTAGANLANINFNRYAGFNTGFHDSRTKNLVGNLDEHATSYNLSAFNKVWRQYTSLRANYSIANQTSWIEANEFNTESYGAGASSKYIRGTIIDAYYTHTSTFNKVNGATETTTKGVNMSTLQSLDQTRKYYGFTFDAGINVGASTRTKNDFYSSNSEYVSVGYSRPLLGGTFNGKWRVDRNNATRNETETTRWTNLFTAGYVKRFTKKLAWNARATRSTSTIDDSLTTSVETRTAIDNTLVWSLRAWRLSAVHSYIITKINAGSESVETELTLRATRIFTRFF